MERTRSDPTSIQTGIDESAYVQLVTKEDVKKLITKAQPTAAKETASVTPAALTAALQAQQTAIVKAIGTHVTNAVTQCAAKASDKTDAAALKNQEAIVKAVTSLDTKVLFSSLALYLTAKSCCIHLPTG
jgi:carbamoylphosphate synthase large subunit